MLYIINLITLIVTFIGGLNWGLVGIFNFNLVDWIFGGRNAGSIIIYILVLLSTFLFAQASTFSIKLAGYTGSIFTTNNVTLGDSMLSLYVEHSDGYKESDEFKNENILNNIKSDNFTKGSHILICGGEIFDKPNDFEILDEFFCKIFHKMLYSTFVL